MELSYNHCYVSARSGALRSLPDRRVALGQTAAFAQYAVHSRRCIRMLTV